MGDNEGGDGKSVVDKKVGKLKFWRREKEREKTWERKVPEFWQKEKPFKIDSHKLKKRLGGRLGTRRGKAPKGGKYYWEENLTHREDTISENSGGMV